MSVSSVALLRGTSFQMSSLVLKRAMSIFLHFSKEADAYSMPVWRKIGTCTCKKWTWPVLVLESSNVK